MKCPACSNTLTEMRLGKVLVDVCQGGCGGIWFDAFELQQVDDPGESAAGIIDVQRQAGLAVNAVPKRACPRCAGIKLKRHFFSARRQVEVDHCPNCGGYWLDYGELEKIRHEKAADLADEKNQSRLTPEVIRFLYRLRIGQRADQ